MTAQHPFIKFLWQTGACRMGMNTVKRYATPGIWWQRCRKPAYKAWLLVTCRQMRASRSVLGLWSNNEISVKLPWRHGMAGLPPMQINEAWARARKLKGAGK